MRATYSNLERAQELRQMAREAARVSLHQIRHSLARCLLRQGATLPEVQHMGHSRLFTTGIYLIPSEGNLRGVIERAGIVEAVEVYQFRVFPQASSPKTYLLQFSFWFFLISVHSSVFPNESYIHFVTLFVSFKGLFLVWKDGMM